MNAGPTPLERLNRAARERAFAIDALGWSMGVDRARDWMPEALAPLSYAPSIVLLDPQQRRRANQLQALALTEKFIWFERLMMASVEVLRHDAGLAPEMAQALADFIADETRHVAVFERLLRLAEPGWYAGTASCLFTLAPLQRHALALAASRPRQLPVWVWLAAFVEERAVFVARQYGGAAAGRVDPLHRQVQAWHLRDEARHCQLDRHLLACFYDPQPAWKKALAAAALRRVVAASLRAGTVAPKVVHQLGREFPALQAAVVPRLLRELPSLHRDAAYHQALFGPAAASRLRGLLSEHPEHAASLRLLTGGAGS
jgi:hypothetical protein